MPPNSSKSATFTLWGAAAALMVRAVGDCFGAVCSLQTALRDKMMMKNVSAGGGREGEDVLAGTFGGGNIHTKRLQLRHSGNCKLARNLGNFPLFSFNLKNKQQKHPDTSHPGGYMSFISLLLV